MDHGPTRCPASRWTGSIAERPVRKCPGIHDDRQALYRIIGLLQRVVMEQGGGERRAAIGKLDDAPRMVDGPARFRLAGRDAPER